MRRGIVTVPTESYVNYSLRPPEGVRDVRTAEAFMDDGTAITGSEPEAVEEVRFDLAELLAVKPEDIYLARLDGLPGDPMDAYGECRTAEAFAVARWNLTSDLEAPGRPPTHLL
jgi:hypothetical protein